MFERSVGNATRRVNVTPFYVWTCSENYNLVVRFGGSDSNLLIVFYVQIMPDDLVMQLHRF
ncbi:hypothetical protein BMT91_23955 [Escherichia coli]|uniref:Uncharacterized protein n=1 Tax=Escherichia coli TaxID=562 RepID=A0AAX0K8M5_ECOLX|nr:hypothetical protein BMT91_23955 [Escherichia coli]